MFCCQCGQKSVNENAKYCSGCGNSLSSLSQEHGKERQEPLSFEEFRKRKEMERTSRFKPNLKKKKVDKTKKKESEVPINIGFMKLESSGSLRRCRGKTLPVKVLPSSGADVILEKGVKKHANHDKNVNENTQYVLLYPDCTQVINLPGTNEPFDLKKYREDIGKSYQRITLFIAKKTDKIFAELNTIYSDNSEDDSDAELSLGINSSTESTVQSDNQTVSTPIDCKPVDLVVIDGPSCSDSLPSQSLPKDTDSQSGQEQLTARMVECPHCFQLFPIENIADHADLCIDDTVGEIDLQTVQEEYVSDLEDMLPVNGKTLKKVVQKLVDEHVNTLEEAKSLRVRRKCLWEDYKAARSRGKLSPSRQIRIIFLGEPAIDDGGPKREFFSGKFKVQYISRFVLS